jgi:hypothetical protein
MGAVGLSRSAIRALPATVDVETAGRAYGVGRTTAYALAKAGKFPCEVIRVGNAYRVLTSSLLKSLGIDPNSDGAGAGTPTPLAENASTHQL